MNSTKDELTPDENEAFKSALAEVVDRFTANVPEDETEPTADDAPEAEAEEAPAEPEAKESTEEPAEEPKAAEETKDSNMPVLIVRDKSPIKQEKAMISSTDYLKTDKAVAAWGKALAASNGDNAAFADSFRKFAKADGVTLGENVSLVPEAVINAVTEQIEDEDRIFSHVFHTGLNFEVAATAASVTGV